MRHFSLLSLVACTFILSGCPSGASTNNVADAGSGDTEALSCQAICGGAGFSAGNKTDYGGGLVECQCSGNGVGLVQAACGEYCAQFNVGAQNAYLSMTVSDNDKCVCDGKQSTKPDSMESTENPWGPMPEGLHENCVTVFSWFCHPNRCSDKNVDFTNQCTWAIENQCDYCSAVIASFSGLEPTYNWTEALPTAAAYN